MMQVNPDHQGQQNSRPIWWVSTSAKIIETQNAAIQLE